MELDHLRLFIAVSASGSFSRAATLIGSTQSAVSKRVLALEQELRCRLFERTGRGARLTDAGRTLLPKAEALVADADNLSDFLAASMERPRGNVRLAVQQSVSWPLVGYLHKQASRRFPHVRLQISEAPMTQIDEWLRDGRVDLAVVARLSPQNPDDSDRLFADAMHLISKAGDEATRGSTIEFARLTRLPLIIASMSNAGRMLVEEEARRRGHALNIALELNSLHLITRMVASGAGYAIMSHRAVSSEIAAGALSASRIVRPRIVHTFYLAIARNREPAAAVRAIAELVREAARPQRTTPAHAPPTCFGRATFEGGHVST